MTATIEPTTTARRRRGPSTESRKRNALVGVRLLPAEMAALRAAAEQDNVSLGEVLRRAFFATPAV